MVFVLAVGWLLVRLVDVVQYALTRDLDIDAEDNLAARRRTTQIDILRRLIIVGIVLLTTAAVLLRFEGFRQIGAGLLASAGIAGIVLGFAAQRALGNLVAGIQIAITQPIRIEDVVVIEGEWGRIEEITLTYVVVRIWDLRRLVVPIGYFIEKPFTNWTRTAANLLGTAYVYVDYSVPVEAVREELHRVLQASEWWDGEAWALQVTDLTERTVQLRALMSAANSATPSTSAATSASGSPRSSRPSTRTPSRRCAPASHPATAWRNRPPPVTREPVQPPRGSWRSLAFTANSHSSLPSGS